MKALPLVLAASLVGSMTAICETVSNEPPAAAAAFTSDDSVVRQAQDLANAGKFQEAEALLKKGDEAASPGALRARQETLEILRRTRIEYSLTEAELLEKLKKTIPNVTAAEVQKWADESHARYRMIDGQKFYFRREPQNIFLFSSEAKAHRKNAGKEPATAKWKLTDHLKAIVDAAEKSGDAEVVPVKHTVSYTVTLKPNTDGVKTGSVVRVWLPYPQEYRQQRNLKLISTSPAPKLVAPTAIEGIPVQGGPQRTIYFEQQVADPSKPLEFKEQFEYTSFAYYPKLDPAKVQPLPANWSGADLSERLPHIVFTPELRKQAAEIVGNETNALIKARKIFRWVSANIKWNAEDEYCLIPSLAMKGYAAKRGDCGVQNTVFVTLCRIAGIPARWQSGWETKPSSWGMHDWAEFYVAPWGWLPADASYGVQKSDDPRIADFYCGHQDSYRMIVNLDWGRELFPPKQSLRSEPADFQRGEVEVDGKNLYFDEWDYVMKVVRDPGPNPD
jgi:transglutaminase-like putative cysteine protease